MATTQSRPAESDFHDGNPSLQRSADGFGAEEITSIIPIDEFDRYETAYRAYADSITEPWSPPRRPSIPSPAETTQDILLPEYEFDEDTHHDPFDVDGAEYDDYVYVPAASPARPRRGGRHRLAAPPSGLKGGRAALIAMAAGAAVAAATGQFTAHQTEDKASDQPARAAVVPDTGPGVVAGTPSKDLRNFADQLAAGEALAKDNAAKDAASRRPFYVSPVALGAYDFTSCYCGRWGSFHAGIDMAAPLGTPIHAATDGVVVEAGPASGFGNWIQVKAPDGTITVYGHMFSDGVNVSKGQHVTAGDVIGHVGSDGQSTGPHCHFEVWKNGVTKIDPAPWLAQHGVVLAGYTG
ncbi:M23 family metallopeptidase [Williamsia sterculiae]|uniref:Peptidase family M23 n=1 Tax=Williamsia sterculiae TaxID=1344003 RepID=A0A1N7DI58_9NOCA|nr:M23 family metallopeptidase [Williamsia sterculiae]SIR75474.1 Peptidase family M23 [Williamsia sterculiae]